MKRYSAKLLSLVCLFGMVGCANQLFYHPDAVEYATPEKEGYAYETVNFEAGDGVTLHGWIVSSVGDESKGVVLHFHGNAQNLSAHYSYVSWLPKYGYDLIVFDYRGYGASGGRTTRDGLFEDSLAALSLASDYAKDKERPLFVIGQSLGGANAVAALGSRHWPEVKGAVIDSAFSSYRSVAKAAVRRSGLTKPLVWAMPLLVSEGRDPIDYVAEISPVPLAFIHGTEDAVVPFDESRLLVEKAGEPKYFWRIEGGQHANALSTNRHVFIPRILEFFDQCRSGRHGERNAISSLD